MAKSPTPNRPPVSATHQQRWLSQSESAEFIGVSERTVRSYIARGVLPAHRVRGSRLIRINLADLEALLVRIPTADGGHDAA